MSFYVFLKISNFCSESICVAYGFTKNHQIVVKIVRNSVILGPNPHILDRLYILVSYMSFFGFSIF
jgi:hypothetical protein